MIESLLTMFKAVQGLMPVADAFAGTVTSVAVNTKLYGKVYGLILKGVGTTGTSTITADASSDSSGTGATAVPFKYVSNTTSDTFSAVTAAAAAGFDTTAGSAQIYLIEIDSRDLPADKPWVRIKGVEVVDSPVVGAILVLCGQPRYLQNPLPSAL